MQLALALPEEDAAACQNVGGHRDPFKTQLLKWIGNKQRLAPGIIRYFPSSFGTYFEPFLGSGGVLGVLAPQKAEASDCFGPLIDIWQCLKSDPQELKNWYSDRWNLAHSTEKVAGYEAIKLSYNSHPNGADLLYLSRSCYGGVVRFRQRDGYMSTPCGAHEPVSPQSFNARVDEWSKRVRGTDFIARDYRDAFERAQRGDLIYCDPPYSHSQAILYGAQKFSLEDLYGAISAAKSRGVFVALSIDGSKKSGTVDCDVGAPSGLFAREVGVSLGRSMLRRFQMGGQTLEKELVTDRLLLTY